VERYEFHASLCRFWHAFQIRVRDDKNCLDGFLNCDSRKALWLLVGYRTVPYRTVHQHWGRKPNWNDAAKWAVDFLFIIHYYFTSRCSQILNRNPAAERKFLGSSHCSLVSIIDYVSDTSSSVKTIVCENETFYG